MDFMQHKHYNKSESKQNPFENHLGQVIQSNVSLTTSLSK